MRAERITQIPATPPPDTIALHLTIEEASILRFVVARQSAVMSEVRSQWSQVKDPGAIGDFMAQVYEQLERVAVPMMRGL